MKTLPMIGSVAVALVAAAAQADYRVAAGDPGGTYYDVFGVNLSLVMREQGHTFGLLKTKGSVDNLNRIAAGEADFGFTQGDALAAWLKEHPTADLDILGPLGQECIYVAAREDGPVQDEDDLEQAGINWAVGAKGTGSAATHGFLATLEPGYLEPNIHFQGGPRTLGKVATGQLDAFMWVTSPHNLNHQYLEIVMREGSGLRLIDMDDWNLNDTLPNGDAVYTFDDVIVRDSWIDTTVSTACMGVLVVGSASVDPDVLDDVAAALLLNGNRIAGK